jgi:hypothetical protein
VSSGNCRPEVWVSGPLGANRLYIYTGVAIFLIKGTGGTWFRDYVDFEPGRVFPHGQVKEERIKLRADLAVRVADGYIQRMEYQVTVLAKV